MTSKILRLPHVMAQTGLSRSSVYLRVAQGLLPKPISLGSRAVGWPENEIDAINAARIAGRTNVEINHLVVILERQRDMACCQFPECSAQLES